MENQATILEKMIENKAVRYVFYIILSGVGAFLVFFSTFVVSVSLGATTENTVGVFGYKVYTARNDIENTDIRSGSLVIIKNTDTDDFYTPEYLSKNAIVIRGMGHILSEYSTYIAVVLMLPIALFFLFVLMREINKKLAIREKRKFETELDFSGMYTFEEDETEKV